LRTSFGDWAEVVYSHLLCHSPLMNSPLQALIKHKWLPPKEREFAVKVTPLPTLLQKALEVPLGKRVEVSFGPFKLSALADLLKIETRRNEHFTAVGPRFPLSAAEPLYTSREGRRFIAELAKGGWT